HRSYEPPAGSPGVTIADTRRVRIARGFQRENQRQRHLSFLQIAQHWLAKLLWRGREVQKIVDQLKREPRVAPVFRHRLFDVPRLLPQHSAQPRASTEQASGLAIRKVRRLLRGQIDLTEPSKLEQLAFNHVLREIYQNVENGEIAFAQGH